MSREIPNHGTLARYKSKRAPCKCAACRAANNKHVRGAKTTRVLIPRERMAAILRRELPNYTKLTVREASFEGGPKGPYQIETSGSLELMAEHIAEATGRSQVAVARKLRLILGTPEMSRNGKTRANGDLRFDTADYILVGLGRTDLWHSELADLYEGAVRSEDAYRPIVLEEAA